MVLCARRGLHRGDWRQTSPTEARGFDPRAARGASFVGEPPGTLLIAFAPANKMDAYFRVIEKLGRPKPMGRLTGQGTHARLRHGASRAAFIRRIEQIDPAERIRTGG